MSKSEKPHEMKMILEFSDSGLNIVFRRCSCKAGKGHCHHLLALAYVVLSSMKESDGASACTSKPKQWHVPRGAKIDLQCWMQLNFSKPLLGGASLCLYNPRLLKRKDLEESKQIFPVSRKILKGMPNCTSCSHGNNIQGTISAF